MVPVDRSHVGKRALLVLTLLLLSVVTFFSGPNLTVLHESVEDRMDKRSSRGDRLALKHGSHGLIDDKASNDMKKATYPPTRARLPFVETMNATLAE